MIQWPQTLLKSMLFNNLTVFFGAGVTKELGFKLWSELIEQLRSEISLNDDLVKELTESINSNNYLNAMDIFFSEKEQETVSLINRMYMLDEFDKNQILNSNEALLFELGASAYLTTNVDNSLEEVLGKKGKKSTVIYSYKNQEDIKDKLVDRDFDRNPLVVRLHGDLKEAKSLIFSQKQYSQLTKDNNFVFQYLIPSLLVSTMTLFVGYSIGDPDIQLILENTSRVRGLNLNLVLINTDPKLSTHQKELFTMRYGIKVIDIKFDELDQTQALKRGLTELATIRKKLKDLQPGDARDILLSGEIKRNSKLEELITANNISS